MVNLLHQAAGVVQVVDVGSYPGSRRNPNTAGTSTSGVGLPVAGVLGLHIVRTRGLRTKGTVLLGLV